MKSAGTFCLFALVILGIVFGFYKFICIYTEDKLNAVQRYENTILIDKIYVPEETSVDVDSEGNVSVDYDPPEYYFVYDNNIKRRVDREMFYYYNVGSLWERSWRQGRWVHNENWRRIEKVSTKVPLE